MVEPVRVDLYGTDEGLLRETVKHSVTLDLDGYPRADIDVPLDLRDYDHQGQHFTLSINGGPPEQLNTYEHRGEPFEVAKRKRDKGRLEKIRSFLRRGGAKTDKYLAKDASDAFNEIENGALLFEVRGKGGDGDYRTKGEPVRGHIEDKGRYIQRLNAIEELAEDNKILDNDLLENQKSRYMGCSHYAKTNPHTSPHRAWEEFADTDVEVAAHIDVGLDQPVAIGYLGERYRGESTFGYRIEDQQGRVSPSNYSKEEETIARELEDVVKRVESYLED